MASTLALSAIKRRPLSRWRGNPWLLLLAAFFIAVLIVEAAVIALNAPDIADVVSLYGPTT